MIMRRAILAGGVALAMPGGFARREPRGQAARWKLKLTETGK